MGAYEEYTASLSEEEKEKHQKDVERYLKKITRGAEEEPAPIPSDLMTTMGPELQRQQEMERLKDISRLSREGGDYTRAQRRAALKARMGMVDPATGLTEGEKRAKMATTIMGGLSGVTESIRQGMGLGGDPGRAFAQTQHLLGQFEGPAQARLQALRPGGKEGLEMLKMRNPQENKLRTEFQKSKEASNMMNSIDAAGSIISLLGRPTGIQDLTTIYTYIKSLDNSTVREGEIRIFDETSPLFKKFELWRKKATKGELLPDDLRFDLADAVLKTLKRRNSYLGEKIEKQKKLAALYKDVGVRPEATYEAYDAPIAELEQAMRDFQKKSKLLSGRLKEVQVGETQQKGEFIRGAVYDFPNGVTAKFLGMVDDDEQWEILD